jgi:alkyldihydroxyacetonephosphate synthase
MAHISHIYRTGACIYFTFIIKPEKEDDLSVLRDRMVESFLGSGGSISHHHGLGNYLDKFLESRKKELMKSLRDPVFSRW